jgi:hypothetical protein
MHLVLIAWVYVVGTMALTADSVVAGFVLFAALGMGPVLVVLALAGRRARARRAAARSVLERGVRDRDDGDA